MFSRVSDLDVGADVLIKIIEQVLAAAHDLLSWPAGTKDAGDGRGEGVPLAGFGGELPASFGGEAVELGAAILSEVPSSTLIHWRLIRRWRAG